MSVVITTYTLASGLMQQGMTWWQALVTILLGNAIVLIPMILNAHAGTKYGVSFPVLCRAAFGVKGANVPAILRAIVACGWFGIQTWIGALALQALLTAAWPGWANVPGVDLDLVRDLLARRRSRSSSAVSKASSCSRAGRRRCCSAAARCCCGGRSTTAAAWPHPLRSAEAAAGQHAVLDAVSRGADRERRLLGDAQPEHSRLHALRAEPALAGARPGARTAGDDDGVCVSSAWR